MKKINKDSENASLPRYTIKEVAEITKLSAYTLRYYDKVNLFPHLQRDENNIRIFCDADIEWINLVQCLRKTGMSIEAIKLYVELNQQGESTLNERYQIICKQEYILLDQIDKIKSGLECLQRKKVFYENKLSRVEDAKNGKTDTV